MLQSTEKFSHVRFAGTPSDARSPRRSPAQEDAPRRPSTHLVPVRPVLTDEHLLVHEILRRSGVEPGAYRTEALIRRVPACLRTLKVKNTADAITRLAQHPERLEIAANALLIGVTDFFRDVSAYHQLRATVIPELVARSGPIRVLSAACSDGAELYSLGMCVAEHEALSRCTLVGVDCRSQALERARDAWYPDGAIHGIPIECRARFVRVEAGGFQVNDAIRAAATWHKGDVCRLTDTSPFHLVACRNVAIYLQTDAAERLWSTLASVLAPGGILFAGKAERPRNGFIRIAPCIFKKV